MHKEREEKMTFGWVSNSAKKSKVVYFEVHFSQRDFLAVKSGT